jgi:hypothetical protein
MKRLLRTMLICCILSTLLCSGAVLIGRSQPMPEFLPNLSTCDGVPCYMGVVLNKTTLEQVDRIFSKPGISGLASLGMEITNGPVEYINFFSTNNDKSIIVTMTLQIREGALSAYRIITDMGVPCAVSLWEDYPTGYRIVLFYSDKIVWVKARGTALMPGSYVTAITLGPYTKGQPDRCQLVDAQSQFVWRGFRTYPPPQP